MCGILCIFEILAGVDVAARKKALQLAKRLRHRGPDEQGIYAKGTTILAHQRLSIVDPVSGAQPLYDSSGSIVLCVNGEIYNHKELMKRTPEFEYATHSDCEVILALYTKGTEDFVTLLNGMFAFALYDGKKDTYTAARDHIGIIPLYYGRGPDGSLWFSSELKALADQCPWFDEFPPGHLYTKEHGLKRWFEPVWRQPKYLPNVQADVVQLRQQLEAAVHRQLMSDVPYGVLLSGGNRICSHVPVLSCFAPGLDSSIISAIACRAKPQQETKETVAHSALRVDDKVMSFSIGLKGSPDLAAAKKVADFIGSVHHTITFTVQQGLDALEDVIYHLETYDVTTIRASTPMYLMARRVRALGVKMVLSGEGADEVFAGYLYFHKAPNKSALQEELVRKVTQLNKYDCLRANKSMSAWGVEPRVPFLDKVFLKYAMALDPASKMCGGTKIEKFILRKAFEGYLPEEVLWRQKEQFSDGVGYSWIDSLKLAAEEQVSDGMFKAASHRFPYNTPRTKEAYYYREIFERHFPQQNAAACVPSGPSVACSTPAAIAWDKAFQDMQDPSGRAVGVHTAAYDQE